MSAIEGRARLFLSISILATIPSAFCGCGGEGVIPPAPSAITTHPADQAVTAGATATFSVNATGSGTLTYQWQEYDGFVWQDISGAASSSYTTPTTVPADDGALFRCVVTGDDDSVTSNVAAIVMTAPTITTPPVSQTVTERETATFSVTATGSGTLSYQWRKDTVDISGATGSSDTTPATTLTDDGAQFTCVVSNVTGNVTSSAATLTVDMAPPLVTTHPANQTVLEGETATFSVVATGSGTITYQWQRDSVNVTGGTGGTTVSYTTPTTVLADSGAEFTCVVTNGAGSVTSNVATLTVHILLTETYVIVDLTTGDVTQAATIPDLLTNDVYKTTQLVLKRIPAGSFQMGDQVGNGHSDELPVHTVNITQPFYMGVFEVTQRQWYEIETTWPSWFTSDPTSLNEKRPVEQVSWDDINGASGFMDSLSSLAPMTLRLPTEAEWEYCCKAGTSTNYSYGDTEDGAWMWYWVNSRDDGIHEVATTTSKPNPWGLYDMYGNAWEWCEDWYGEGHYSISPVDDPSGPTSGSDRAIRGGGWGTTGNGCRSANRTWYDPATRSVSIGFRVVVSAPGP